MLILHKYTLKVILPIISKSINAFLSVCLSLCSNYMYVYTSFLDTDIDECNEGTDTCDHVCANTVGSFSCSCHPGYHLLDDGSTCAGKANIMSLDVCGKKILCWTGPLRRPQCISQCLLVDLLLQYSVDKSTRSLHKKCWMKMSCVYLTLINTFNNICG